MSSHGKIQKAYLQACYDDSTNNIISKLVQVGYTNVRLTNFNKELYNRGEGDHIDAIFVEGDINCTGRPKCRAQSCHNGGWPALWCIVELSGLGLGCGGARSKQLRTFGSFCIDGLQSDKDRYDRAWHNKNWRKTKIYERLEFEEYIRSYTW